ncbi:glycine betaine/L-proline ABC transporter, ATPase subunit [Catenulispora acidiphila DSM 44928]|uniref:ABC-type quaternary amine transporter n=1 Tax=Catenulispora acidiphila (strain DSM 44928 / JCM 14897 / NBRC 102108 / NRRL B-24433 / ID139908) TaxID=479433 RepID=C7Q4M7_CATAD|nr:ABC transporter ATP-binding protein [Catenulispora acidiphila]ACU71996.1 glycine betaine/L-proline ABC transporter, ATPase subunit [Catenulispora acidiphila DSM 44928]
MISFVQVGKTYPDGTVAVAATDLTAESGRITVLVGPSGSGKTTLLRMVNRMIDPTSGEILIDGVDVRSKSAPELRRGIGYVIQNAGLFPHRTVLANVMTVPRLLGWSREKARERAMELLTTVGLEESHAKRYPFQLSGGQQQRVGVARALAADPPVLLMDEPFSAVDPVVRKDLQTELLRLQSELSKTILFVTHDIDEAIQLGDKVAVLNTGGLLEQFDTPTELLAHPKNAFVESFLGLDRGVRRLSFFSSSGVPLRPEPVVARSAPPAEVLARKGSQPWLLVVDEAHRPLGWLPADQVPGDGDLGSVPVGDLTSYGHTFDAETDSLRAALDSAILSPSSRAVGVGDDGRVIGVASVEELVPAIRAAQDGSAQATIHGNPEIGEGGAADAGAGVDEAGSTSPGQFGNPATGQVDLPVADQADRPETGEDSNPETS